MNNKVELLSPAGDLEGFYGAINAGADAVYLSGKQFGARAYAGNFSEEEIVSCIRYAHLFGKKVYLTVNTLLKEAEISSLFDYLKPLYEAGLDAVIVQDLGVFSFIRKHFPDMDIHVSTQMTITGKLGCQELLKEGATRVVPARELSLKEIAEIKSTVPIEIECFVHGAMCYCYSGQCLFSSFLGERSGNRGRCAQPCRLPYRSQKNTDIYPLSLKDMNTLEHIPELIEAGIDSFKIEGRMKKPEYTAGVTAIYRKYIDLYYKNQFHGISEKDRKKLASLYTRSETESGYYFRHNGKEMVTISKPSYNDNDESLLRIIHEQYIVPKKKMNISMKAQFLAGKPCSLQLFNEISMVTVYGEEVCIAQNRPITEENIRTQLNKLGDSPFALDDLSIHMEQNVFMPIKSLNELRRTGIALLWDTILSENGFGQRTILLNASSDTESGFDNYFIEEKLCTDIERKTSHGYHILVNSMEQLVAVEKLLQNKPNDITRFYIACKLLEDSLPEVKRILAGFVKNLECFISLPYITRQQDYPNLEKIFELYKMNIDRFHGFQVRNMEQYAFLSKKMEPEKICLDSNMYVWNTSCADFWSDKSKEFCLPLELKWDEQKELIAKLQNILYGEKMVYGYVPMMQTANCVMKTLYGCQLAKNNKKTFITIKDRYQKEFFVYLNCKECYNTIYNSVPLSLHKDISRWKDKLALRLDFTIENKAETEKIIQYFVLNHGQGNLPYKDYTTGHENRGVE